MSARLWFPYVVRMRLPDVGWDQGVIVAAFVSLDDAQAYTDRLQARLTACYQVEEVSA